MRSKQKEEAQKVVERLSDSIEKKRWNVEILQQKKLKIKWKFDAAFQMLWIECFVIIGNMRNQQMNKAWKMEIRLILIIDKMKQITL